MVDTKKKVQEITTLLEEVWTETKGLTPEEQSKRTELRQKIDALDLTELENLADLTLQEKARLLSAKAQLEQSLKQEKTDHQSTKEALAQQKKEVGEKITQELVEKLSQIANKNLELKRVPKKDQDGNDLKDAQGNTIYEELIDIEQLKSAVQEQKAQVDTKALAQELQKNQPTNYWVISGVVMGSLSLLGIIALWVKASQQNKEK